VGKGGCGGGHHINEGCGTGRGVKSSGETRRQARRAGRVIKSAVRLCGLLVGSVWCWGGVGVGGWFFCVGWGSWVSMN